jgi:hypothetical protein
MSTKVTPVKADDTAPVTSDDTTPADDTVDPVAGHPRHPILGGDDQVSTPEAARAPESPNSQRRGVPCKGGDGVLNGSENDQARVAKLWVMCIVLPKESADDEDVPIESKISLLSKCLPAVAADRARRVEFKKLIRQAVLDAEAEDGAVLASQGAGSSNEHYLSKLSCAHRCCVTGPALQLKQIGLKPEDKETFDQDACVSAKTWRIALQNSIAATLLLGCNIDTKIVVTPFQVTFSVCSPHISIINSHSPGVPAPARAQITNGIRGRENQTPSPVQRGGGSGSAFLGRC